MNTFTLAGHQYSCPLPITQAQQIHIECAYRTAFQTWKSENPNTYAKSIPTAKRAAAADYERIADERERENKHSETLYWRTRIPDIDDVIYRTWILANEKSDTCRAALFSVLLVPSDSLVLLSDDLAAATPAEVDAIENFIAASASESPANAPESSNDSTSDSAQD